MKSKKKNKNKRIPGYQLYTDHISVKKHSTITAAINVINDITEALDKKHCCLSLSKDLSKAFDTVDHNILIKRLTDIVFSELAVGWVANYLTYRTQAIELEGANLKVLQVLKRYHKGQFWVLYYLLYMFKCNEKNTPNYVIHFYVDDSFLYCFAPTPAKASAYLQYTLV